MIMRDRTFHKRITLPVRLGMGLFTVLTVYFFWVKTAILGILVAIVIVGMIERILHTTYTIRRVKPIDRDEEIDFLIIDEGRFSTNRNVPLCDVVRMESISCFFGLDHCLLIEYGAGNMVTVQPDNEEGMKKAIAERIGESVQANVKKE